jgi:hypothetical protein
MVIAGVADRVPDRLTQIVFVDAPVPRHGDTLFDHLPDAGPVIEWYREQARTVGEGWRVPAPDLAFHGLAAADIAWLTPMLGSVPLRTCEEPLQGAGSRPVGTASDLCLVSCVPAICANRSPHPGRGGVDLPGVGDGAPSHGHASRPGSQPAHGC